MLQIKKLRADHVIDFAAEEMKKYLRMMMPECGDIDILYAPGAEDGFRLGLAEDFGLTFSEAEDPTLDDVVHIETDTQGGILAGSNSRSVLFAVYRFFKENGCRWLFPGIDGEYIPMQDIKPISYHHMADHRFRGHCNEGAESQQCMMDTIDFNTKLEMNVYMIEFFNPYCYYASYYDHEMNEQNRPPEPVSYDQVLQWKRLCEVEIAKRGLQFHDMGHGWTAEPFGIASTEGWKASSEELPEETKQYLALIDGERKLWRGVALNTNLCMSNPKVRTIMAKAIADYAENHKNVTYIHVWLADGHNNHCECEECKKLNPSDYYMMIMNELDEELTARKLDSKIVFIAYVDTMYAPLQERIHNSKRFALLWAPIQRSYTSSVDASRIQPTPAYIRNNWPRPVSAEESAAFLLDWQKGWKGECFCYEYHFWRHMCYDPGMMAISRRIYEDIVSMKTIGINGIVEDGSQRCFFPNGFAFYIYAEALRDRNCDYDKVKADYFRYAYGELAEEAEKYLQSVSDTFDFAYMEGECSEDPAKSGYYGEKHAQRLEKVFGLAEEGRKLALANMAMPTRCQTVSMRMLLRHAEFCEKTAQVYIALAKGENLQARKLWEEFRHSFGQYEFELERYFDHYQWLRTIGQCIPKEVQDKKPGE